MRANLLVCLMSLVGTAFAAEPVAFRAEAKVEIDAAGKPTKIEASSDLPDGVRKFIEARVATWQFAPPSRDGVVSSGVTYLKLGACAMPVENGYRMAVDFKGSGPRLRGMSMLPPPRYPPEAQHSGQEADLVIDWIVEPDGRATLERIERKDGVVSRKNDSFYRVVREWVATLRYEPEELAGQPVRTRVSVPVQFELGSAGFSRGAYKRELQERASQSPECQVAASKLQQGLQPVAVDSPFKLLNAG